MKRYRTLSDHFKDKYGKKLVKLSVDGGFTCPNRDGTFGHDGCIFCSEEGSGEFSGLILSGKKVISEDILEQMESQKELLSTKWSSTSYIAYFQNYTNTYKALDSLNTLYKTALSSAGVEGIVISTRPDCIDVSHLKVFNDNRVLWVELGLQTVHDEKSAWLRRHYTFDDFLRAAHLLASANIDVVAHLIAGIPGETKADFLESVKAVSKLDLFGVKFHMLNIVEGTDLGEMYKKEPWPLLDEASYIEWICDAIEFLNPRTVIHRLTGDADKCKLIAPKWILNKRSVLNGIDKCLAYRKSRQGIKFLE